MGFGNWLRQLFNSSLWIGVSCFGGWHLNGYVELNETAFFARLHRPISSPMWCKVVMTVKETSNERKTVGGKEPEGSEESGSPGVDHIPARSLQES
jgi:hypothetical protein